MGRVSLLEDFDIIGFSDENMKIMWNISLKRTADISRPRHWFPGEMTSEKQAPKFHTDDLSLPRSG